MSTSQFAFVLWELIFTTSSYSPAQGAMYASLALRFVFPGAIVGGTIGGVADLLAIGIIAFILRCRQRSTSVEYFRLFIETFPGTTTDENFQVTVPPYSPRESAPTEAVPPGVSSQMDQQQHTIQPFSPGGHTALITG